MTPGADKEMCGCEIDQPIPAELPVQLLHMAKASDESRMCMLIHMHCCATLASVPDCTWLLGKT